MSLISKLLNRKAYHRKWDVGLEGRDQIYYQELINDEWCKILIDGEMLVGGDAHHVIYFDTTEQWAQKYPEWAKGRRAEIICRIKSELTPPNYVYHGA